MADEAVGGDDRKRRQSLGEFPSAQFANHQDNEKKDGGAGKSRKKSQRAEGIAEEKAIDPENGDGERRLIDISKGKVIAASDVVELVSKIAIIAVESHLEHELKKSQEEREGELR